MAESPRRPRMKKGRRISDIANLREIKDNFQIFGRESQVFIDIVDGGDNTLDPGDYIEFYAKTCFPNFLNYYTFVILSPPSNSSNCIVLF